MQLSFIFQGTFSSNSSICKVFTPKRTRDFQVRNIPVLAARQNQSPSTAGRCHPGLDLAHAPRSCGHPAFCKATQQRSRSPLEGKGLHSSHLAHASSAHFFSPSCSMKPVADVQHQNLLFTHRSSSINLCRSQCHALWDQVHEHNDFMSLFLLSDQLLCKGPGCSSHVPPTCLGITGLKHCPCTRNKSTFNILQLL